MPVSEPSRVFISYAHKDGAIIAQRLCSDLRAKGFDAWLDTQRIRGGALWSMEIEREIDSREVTLALLSPGSYTSEICRSEQLRALDKGKRVIPVLAVASSDRPIYLYARQYRDFTDAANYNARLAELLADIRSNATATLPETYRKTRVTYLTAPPRVANYLERTAALHALRDALFAEDHRQPIALTALAGMGGIGKTVQAKALTDDEVVRRAFPDGIVWITAGKERTRDFIEEMREVAKALGEDLSHYDTALACENQYRTTIANKAALIVVDDVWSKSDIEPLLAESSRSRFLFTTRDAAIGRFVGAHEHRADLLDATQSRELLAAWANLLVAELPAAADEVIAECGRLPLALSVVGAMLRGADTEFWMDTRELLRNADLSAIKEQLPEGQDSFFKAVEVSFQSLKPEMQERYKALAVLLEDMAAPMPILETLWNTDRPETRRISQHFVDRSLAQRDGANESIRLHGLQLDYARAQYPDKESLALIHGAVRLSSSVIAEDPNQFASQIVGRLLSFRDMPAIDEFVKRIAEGMQSSWLRPLRATLNPSGTALVRSIEADRSIVNGVALRGDGQIAILACSAPTLKVWEVESGRELRNLIGHSQSVNAVAVTPDGQIAVSASEDETLKVWEVESGRELRNLIGHSRFNAVAVTPDGKYAVSGSSDRSLKVWDLAAGRELRTLERVLGGVLNRVAISADGRLVVATSGGNTVKMWDVASGRELRTLEGHTAHVYAVALRGDARLAVSASGDRTLRVWDLDAGRELRTLEGHSDEVLCVAMSGDGRLAISASADRILKVWNIESGRELRTLAGHTDRVCDVAISSDGRLAVSASEDKTLKVWNVTSRRELPRMHGHSHGVKAVAVTPDGKIAVSASKDKTLKVWEVESGSELRSLQGHSDAVWGVVVSANGRRAISASWDQTVKVWDVKSGRGLFTFHWILGSALRLSLDALDEEVLDFIFHGTSSEENSGHAWLAVRVRQLFSFVTSALRWLLFRILRGYSGNLFGMVVRNGVGLAISGDWDAWKGGNKRLRVLDVASGRELRTLAGHTKSVTDAELSWDGRIALSGSFDQTLKVWELCSGRELLSFVHSSCVNAVALTADGKRVVSGSTDKTLKVTDLETGKVLATFTCDGEANCCAVAPNGELIVAGDEGGHVHFLRLEEPKPKS